jgi:hypothetical protein
MNEMAIILQSELKSRNNGVTNVVKSNIKQLWILCTEHHGERRECERSSAIASRCIFC